MSVNLLEIAQTTLSPILLSKAGDLFNLNQEQGKSALDTILPTLLSGVLNKASTKSGAESLYKAITNTSVNTQVNNLTDLLSTPSGASKLSKQGDEALGFLFGDKSNILGEQIAKLTDTPASGTKSLLSIATTAIFSLLKNQVVSKKMSPHAFTSMLASQASYLEKSLPEKILEWLGWGSLAAFFGGLAGKFTGSLNGLSNLFSNDHQNGNNNNKNSYWKWLLPLALLLLAGLLFKSCQKSNPAIETPSNLTVGFDAEKATVAANSNFIEAIKALNSDTCDAESLSKALSLYVINFAAGSNTIPAKDITELALAVPAVTACVKSGVKIEIGGHTDSTGDAASNLELSTTRANAVKSMFIAAGVPADNITTKGYGDSMAIADNTTEEGRFQNRRITYSKQ